MAGFRKSQPLDRRGDDKRPQVLTGPATQVSGQDIRPRAVRAQHIAPGVVTAIHLADDIITTDTGSSGDVYRIGALLICTHRLTGLASGEETWVFPRAFGSAPRVTATPVFGTSARSVSISDVSDSQVTVYAWTDSGGTSDVDVDVIAIGEDSS